MDIFKFGIVFKMELKIMIFLFHIFDLTNGRSELYGIVTYHIDTNLGDTSLSKQFWNPIFILITILLIAFSSFMMSIFILLLCAVLTPHCKQLKRSIRRNCSLVICLSIYLYTIYNKYPRTECRSCFKRRQFTQHRNYSARAQWNHQNSIATPRSVTSTNSHNRTGLI